MSGHSQAAPSAPGQPSVEPPPPRRLRKSSAFLWLLAPLLLLLSSVRPTSTRSDRAVRVPKQFGAFTLKDERKITSNIERLLGTRDVVWREYSDSADNSIFLTAVFHDSNWKSLHPPHICIRGSGFNINVDEDHQVDLGSGSGTATIGRLLATLANHPGRDYVSLYAFVGQDFITPSYFWFYAEHAVPALFRQATPGFLVRIEAFVGKDGPVATEARCLDMFRRFIPVGKNLIQPQ